MFDDTLICDDAASAQAVTFARNVGVRSVTLDEDVYEPSGTMSGGAAPSRSRLLVRVLEMRGAEERVEIARRLRAALGETRGGRARASSRSKSISCDCCRSRLAEAILILRGCVAVLLSSRLPGSSPAEGASTLSQISAQVEELKTAPASSSVQRSAALLRCRIMLSASGKRIQLDRRRLWVRRGEHGEVLRHEPS